VAFKLKWDTFLNAFMVIREEAGFGDSTLEGKWFTREVLAGAGDFSEAYDPWLDVSRRSRADSARLKQARARFESLFRELVGMLKRSPLVSDSALVDMGLPPRYKGNGKPAPVALAAPWYHVAIPRIRCVAVRYGDAATGLKGKPRGQHGVECRWAFSDTPVVDVEDLGRSMFDTRAPLLFEFAGHDRGRVFYFSLRWENTRGEKGPFGPILSAMVP
jgi:hypothetical protein